MEGASSAGASGADEGAGKDTFLTSLRAAGGGEAGKAAKEAVNLAQVFGVSGLGRVQELHGQLTGVVGSLSGKVAELLKKQEEEFLAAYRAHVFNVQKELQDLRAKVRNAELALQRDKTIRQLTQERDWFRKEALRLDAYSTAMRKEIKFMEEKIEAIEEDRGWLEKQLKGSKKQSKLLRTELELHLEGRGLEDEPASGAGGLPNRPGSQPPQAQRRLAPVHSQSSGALIEDTLPRSERGDDKSQRSFRSRSSMGRYSAATAPTATGSGMELLSQETECGTLASHLIPLNGSAAPAGLNATVKQLRDQLAREKEASRELRAALVRDQSSRGELEDFFLQCVEDTKKEVARRRNRAKLAGSKANTKESSAEPSARDLAAVDRKDLSAADRRKVLEQLLMQDDIFDILYHNIFAGGGALKGGAEGEPEGAQQQPSSPKPSPQQNSPSSAEERQAYGSLYLSPEPSPRHQQAFIREHVGEMDLPQLLKHMGSKEA
jgi:hypothetical protein